MADILTNKALAYMGAKADTKLPFDVRPGKLNFIETSDPELFKQFKEVSLYSDSGLAVCTSYACNRVLYAIAKERNLEYADIKDVSDADILMVMMK